MNFFPSFSSLFKAAKIRFSLFWGDWNGSLCSSSFFRFAIAVIDSDACQVSLGEESEELAMMNIFFLLFFSENAVGFLLFQHFLRCQIVLFLNTALLWSVINLSRWTGRLCLFNRPCALVPPFQVQPIFLKRGGRNCGVFLSHFLEDFIDCCREALFGAD